MSHIRKCSFSFIFGSHYMVSMETKMTFPSFSGEGTVFTAIQSLPLRFCKIAPQGDWFLSKKPVVQLVGGSKPLLTLPCNMAFLSRAEDPAFQLDFAGEEDSQHPTLFPKCPGMQGDGGEEVRAVGQGDAGGR